MKYEIILKIKNRGESSYETKYCTVVKAEIWESVFRRYDEEAKVIQQDNRNCECLVLANRLNDNGEFEEVVV